MECLVKDERHLVESQGKHQTNGKGGGTPGNLGTPPNPSKSMRVKLETTQHRRLVAIGQRVPICLLLHFDKKMKQTQTQHQRITASDGKRPIALLGQIGQQAKRRQTPKRRPMAHAQRTELWPTGGKTETWT